MYYLRGDVSVFRRTCRFDEGGVALVFFSCRVHHTRGLRNRALNCRASPPANVVLLLYREASHCGFVVGRLGPIVDREPRVVIRCLVQDKRIAENLKGTAVPDGLFCAEGL